jgi:hypothetical protein
MDSMMSPPHAGEESPSLLDRLAKLPLVILSAISPYKGEKIDILALGFQYLGFVW